MMIYNLFLMLIVQFNVFIFHAPQFSFLTCELLWFFLCKIFCAGFCHYLLLWYLWHVEDQKIFKVKGTSIFLLGKQYIQKLSWLLIVHAMQFNVIIHSYASIESGNPLSIYLCFCLMQDMSLPLKLLVFGNAQSHDYSYF